MFRSLSSAMISPRLRVCVVKCCFLIGAGFLLAAPSPTSASEFLPEPQSEPGAQSYRGHYGNCRYGFGVEIPNQLLGYDEPGPLKIEGVGIILARGTARAHLTAYAMPNSMGIKSLDEAAAAVSKVQCKQRGGNVLSEAHTKVDLGGMEARRVILECRSEGRLVIDDSVTLFHSGRQVVYTVALRADRVAYAKYVAVLDAVLKSWGLREQSCK